MSENGFCPEDFEYMNYKSLVNQLDYLVKDPADKNYIELKKYLMEMAERASNRNPFFAGRPGRFSEKEKQDMYARKKAGDTYRTIAEYYECSTSLVHKAVDEIQREMWRVRK